MDFFVHDVTAKSASSRDTTGGIWCAGNVCHNGGIANILAS